ncbi:hypothetical protein CRG98_047057 [Punica granatum]|uniref:Retrotransposon Copia-like N-terminal domain-containing protein n=1 Tax=Punica granatum TaxID=22663 RepID=A0A2I0HLG2_PUNGR|nr:hypothetical protein CRG98_047057 [Punica granatum]
MTNREDKVESSGKRMQDSAVYRIGSSNSTGVQITSCLLNDDNYLTWSRAMTIALTAEGKLRFVEGEIPRPPPVARSREAAHVPKGVIKLGAFAVKGASENREGQRKTTEGKPFCDHYGRPDHIKGSCWVLHGPPMEGNNKSKGKKVTGQGKQGPHGSWRAYGQLAGQQ